RRLRDGDGAAAKQLDVAAGVGVGAGVGVAAGVRVAAAAVAIVVAAGGGAEDREGPGENVGETTVSENLHGKALLAWAHPRRGSPVRLAHTSARASRASTGTVTFAAKGKRGSHLGI